jgi:hypothetical protein
MSHPALNRNVDSREESLLNLVSAREFIGFLLPENLNEMDDTGRLTALYLSRMLIDDLSGIDYI